MWTAYLHNYRTKKLNIPGRFGFETSSFTLSKGKSFINIFFAQKYHHLLTTQLKIHLCNQKYLEM